MSLNGASELNRMCDDVMGELHKEVEASDMTAEEKWLVIDMYQAGARAAIMAMNEHCKEIERAWAKRYWALRDDHERSSKNAKTR